VRGRRAGIAARAFKRSAPTNCSAPTLAGELGTAPATPMRALRGGWRRHSPAAGAIANCLGRRRRRAVANSAEPHRVINGSWMPTEPEDELTWLRHRIVRMRTILRFAKDPRTEAGLRELIADAEARLAALETSAPRRPA
jgi:hypothetical protein